MDILLASKLLTPLVKDLLKKKDIDLSKEINKINLLYGSLNYAIDTIHHFSTKYLDGDDHKSITNNIKEFFQDYIELLTLVQTSIFLFEQAYLGRFISKTMDSLKSDLERLISAVESEEDFSKKLEKINKGTYQSFKDIRSSMTMVIGILKMHRDHWSVLLKGNQDININNES